MTVIELAKGRGTFTVDDADAEAVQAHRWNLGSKGYVIRTDRSTGRKRTVRLHRWLLGVPDGDPRQVDHINGDPSDCTRGNLRVVAGAENAQNRKLNANSQSGVRGVHRRKDHRHRLKPWVAQCRVDGRQRTLGYFATKDEAAAAVAQVRAAAMPYAVEREVAPRLS